MRSLRARLNLAFVVPTGAIVVVLVVVAYLAGRQGLEDELDRRIEEVGQTVAVDMSEGIDAAQIGRIDESMHRVRDRLEGRLTDIEQATEVRRMFIFDEDARRLVDTDEEGGFGERLYRVEVDRSEIERTFDDRVATSGPLYQTEDGVYHKTAYAPIVDDGETVAAVGVEASADYFELLTGFATVLTLLGALGVGVVVAIGVWFSKLLVRPVDALVEGTEHLAEGDLETPVVARARKSWTQTREYDLLMESFEEMRQAVVERDRRMQMMLGGIAHEVRNPLGGIELYCGLLREDLESLQVAGDRQAGLEMVDRIEREVDYLEGVVESFLDFARPGELEVDRVDGAALVDEVAEVVDNELRKFDCSLEIDVEADLELTVDRGRMRRALINVVRNACQACREVSEPIVVACRVEGDRRILEVRDQGCGIADDELEQLCRPFYTTREKGSGLGLALTRQIVEGHGGSLEIESQVGEGTTVRLVVPFDDDVESSDSGPAGVDERRSGGDEEFDAPEAGRRDVDEVPDGWIG